MTLTTFFKISVGILNLGSFVWAHLLGKESSLGIFRLETFVCVPSLGNSRLDTGLGNFRLEMFVLDLSFGNSRLGSFA